MDGSQAWWQSKTIWAALFAILVPVAGRFLHITITDADISEAAGYAVALASAVAGGVALWGRLTATKTIGPPSNTQK
jgi:hypothetical protein